MTNKYKELTTVIIDDLEAFTDELTDFLSDYGDLTVVAEAHSAKSGYDTILEHQPDLVFLDLEMENKDSGIQLATQIRKISPNLFKQPCIVFMTAYSGYDFPSIVKNNPISFLKKPITSENILYAISAVRAVLENTDKEEVLTRYMVIEGQNKYIINPKKDILYIRSLNNSTYIFLEDGRELKTNITLGYYQKIFEPINICRVGKSDIVNLYKIDSIQGLRNELKKKDTPVTEHKITLKNNESNISKVELTEHEKKKKEGSVTRHKIIIKNHETNISLGKKYYEVIISMLERLK